MPEYLVRVTLLVDGSMGSTGWGWGILPAVAPSDRGDASFGDSRSSPSRSTTSAPPSGGVPSATRALQRNQ